MFEEIDKLEENIFTSERIKDLLIVLVRNYFTKKDYNHLKIEEAYELCSNYQDIQVLIDVILDLSIENNEKLRKNFDVLINKEKEMREGKKNAEYQS